MQTIASLAKRLDMGAEKAVEVLRYLFFDVDSVDTVISDEECDLLIDIDDDPAIAERLRDAKLKERKRAESAQKKADAKRKADEKKAQEEAAAKRKEEEEAAQAAAEAAARAAEAEAAARAAEAEAVVVEEPAVEAEPAAEPVAVVEAEPEPEPVPAPVAAVVAPVHEEKPAGRVLAEIITEEPKKEPSLKIGVAIEHEEHPVEILRADGTRVDIPDAEAIGVEAAPEEEEEETGLLAEAQRRQEEEEKRRAKLNARPLPQPDPAVVAEVIRRAQERSQKQKKDQQKPPAAVNVKAQKLEKAQKTERHQVQPPPPQSEERPERRSSATGKTARKRQKRAERERMEEVLRRDAAMAVREYQTGGFSAPKKHKKKRVHTEDGTGVAAEEPEIIEITDTITVEQLAKAMDVPVNELILDLMDHNVLATKNQILSVDMARQVAEPRGFELRTIVPEESELLVDEPDDPKDLVTRAPVITVMGHVDHGKTTLLDAVRSANVAAGEAGGITQHIAAYEVVTRSGRVVFLDTPGHEAFTQMRARGAKATDIVVLVVAADDGIMPQTIEAIDHAKAAEVPIVVAVNKCDKPDAQPDRIRQELTQFGLVAEEWGGKTIMKNISAKMKQGIDELMELLWLESEMLELKANPNKSARGVVIESEITRGMGPVAWVLVQSGTLRVGDIFLAGETYGRVRTLQNSRGEFVQEALPSTPVVVTGFNEPPEAGTSFVVMKDERIARDIAAKRAGIERQKQGPTARHITLEDFHARMLAGDKKQLNVVLKADVQGSVDVFRSSLAKLGNEEVRVELVHAGVGGVNESDVLLASASDAVIIGFHVTASAKVKKLSEKEGVDIRTYRVIYEAIADVKAALEGMLKPETKETVTGHAEIRAIFRSSALGNVAGCYITDGEVFRGTLVRLVRDGVIVYDGRLGSLRRIKEDVRVVTAGLECGIKLENYEDIKEGDVLEAYKVEEVAKQLE